MIKTQENFEKSMKEEFKAESERLQEMFKHTEEELKRIESVIEASQQRDPRQGLNNLLTLMKSKAKMMTSHCHQDSQNNSKKKAPRVNTHKCEAEKMMDNVA